MGWERKRGKLHELNRLLRCSVDITYVSVGGRPPEEAIPGVRYVITPDADTCLPRVAAARLVGTMLGAADGPGIPARRGGCIVRDWNGSSGSACAAQRSASTPALPALGLAIRSAFVITRQPTKSG
jgi:hypothetical protein